MIILVRLGERCLDGIWLIRLSVLMIVEDPENLLPQLCSDAII